jgi:hypothetical protein
VLPLWQDSEAPGDRQRLVEVHQSDDVDNGSRRLHEYATAGPATGPAPSSLVAW